MICNRMLHIEGKCGRMKRSRVWQEETYCGAPEILPYTQCFIKKEIFAGKCKFVIGSDRGRPIRGMRVWGEGYG